MIRKALTAILLGLWFLHTLFYAPFFEDLGRATDSSLSYRAKWSWYAFNGLDVIELGKKLNQLVPLSEPVALSAGILKNDFLMQRLSEGLYPRLLDGNARYQLSLQPLLQPSSQAQNPPSETSTAEALSTPSITSEQDTNLLKSIEIFTAPSLKIYLTKMPPSPTSLGTEAFEMGSGVSLDEGFSVSIFQFLVCLFAMASLGWLVVWGLEVVGIGGLRTNPLHLPFWSRLGFYLLVGGLLNSGLASISTWLQLPLPAQLRLILATIVFGVWGVKKFSKQTVHDVFKKYLAELKHSSSFLFAPIFLFLLWQLWNFPVSLWDGRSVWLFNTKKLFFSGMMPLKLLLKPEYQWSNPIYPLFIPSWHSFFQGFGSIYSERQLSLGIAVLLFALLSVFYSLLKNIKGTFFSSIATLVFFLFSFHMTTGGYVDSLVLFLLLNGILALCLSRDQTGSVKNNLYTLVAIIHFSILSLTKAEGLALSFFVVAFYFIFTRSLKACIPVSISLLPGILHRLWAQFSGVKSVFNDTIPNYTLTQYIERLSQFFQNVPALFATAGYLQFRYVFTQAVIGLFGLAGFLGLSFLLFLQKNKQLRLDPISKMMLQLCLSVAAVFFVTATIIILRMPYDINWLVHVTFDRLMIHVSGLTILATLAILPTQAKNN